MTRFLKGVISGIVAAAIVAGSVCAIGYSSRNAQTGKWFSDKHLSWNKDSSANTNKPSGEAWGGVVDGDGNAMNNVATYAMPAAMAFYSEVATNADIAAYSDISVNITASHNFEYNNVAVDWSAEYASGASAADVLTITPDGDGSLNVAVSCAAPFSTQIILKATSRDNPEVFATTTVDYVKRIQNITNVLGSRDGVIYDNLDGDDNPITFNLGFGEGSKCGEILVKDFEMFFYPTFEQYYCDRLLTSDLNAIKFYRIGNIAVSLVSDSYFSSPGDVIHWKTSNFINNYENADTAHKQAVDYAVYNAYKQRKAENSSKGNMSAQITLQVKVNGAVIQEYSATSLVCNANFAGVDGAENLSPVIDINTGVNL